jgi:CTD small phosphatase-like protein 2
MSQNKLNNTFSNPMRKIQIGFKEGEGNMLTPNRVEIYSSKNTTANRLTSLNNKSFNANAAKSLSSCSVGGNIININLTQNVISTEDKRNSKLDVKAYFDMNLEDLILIEEKLQEILNSMRNGKQAAKICFEWWSFINHCDYHNKLFSFFISKFKDNEFARKVIVESSIFEFLSFIICYDSSSDNTIFLTTVNLLKNLFYIIHQNYLIVCDIILSCLNEDSIVNLWSNKLQNVVFSKLTKRIKNGEHCLIIRQNNENICSSFKNIFRTYPTVGRQSFNVNKTSTTSNSVISQVIQFYKNFAKLSITMLNDFFKEQIGMDKKSKLSTNNVMLSLGNSDNIRNVTVPYLKFPNSNGKEYTLVLDLDETIVHIECPQNKTNIKNDSGFKVHVRPHLYKFLDEVSKYYEIVVFTAALQEYADPIIDYIEYQIGNKIFDYRLYRQHAVVMNEDFIKVSNIVVNNY